MNRGRGLRGLLSGPVMSYLSPRRLRAATLRLVLLLALVAATLGLLQIDSRVPEAGRHQGASDLIVIGDV